MSDDIITRRRRARQEAAQRRTLVLGGAAVLLLGLVCGGLVVVLRPRGVVAVGGGPVAAVGGPAPAALPVAIPSVTVTVGQPEEFGRPTDDQMAELLRHSWWRGQLSEAKATQLLAELTTARIVTVYFNRQGDFISRRDDDRHFVPFPLVTLGSKDNHPRRYREFLGEVDKELSLFAKLGAFGGATQHRAFGGTPTRSEAMRAVRQALELPAYTPNGSARE